MVAHLEMNLQRYCNIQRGWAGWQYNCRSNWNQSPRMDFTVLIICFFL